ncbi:MAG: trk system potassium uptake protein TrkH, partial [Gammaproteobacteria bacterium]
MQLFVIQRIVGILLMLFSVTLLPPMAVSLLYDDGAMAPFVVAFGVVLLTGVIFWIPVQSRRGELRLRDGFIVVALFWTVLALSGALPLVLGTDPHMSFTDAMFESMSALTTTGATTIVGLDGLPASLLFYRQELQWLGGMGIIVLAVAVLPMLGIGGMQLYRAETPGPMKDNKLTPRIAETAKALWYIYLGLTVACTIGYFFAGMNMFDSITHSFATVSTGGLSTHDLSFAYFDSPAIEAVGVVFMLLGGVNFALHFIAFRSLSARPYFGDSEFRTYLWILAVTSVITTAYLYYSTTFSSFGTALRHSVFQVVSIITSTGFTTTGYADWPGFLPAMLLLASFIGGCAGSTSGGLKVIRVMLLIKQAMREIMRLIHPNAEIPVKIGGKTLPYRVVDAIWGFFSLYVICYCLMSLMLMATGLDLVTAFSAVAAC